jgi:beta-lactamase regulating signal transducer with metallopeptidase domain
VIRATIVLLLAHLLAPRLHRRSAAERHLFWAVSLLVASVVPALTLVLPPWRPEWGARLEDLWSATVLSPWASRQGVEVVVRATGVEPAAWTPGQWLILLWAAGTAGVALVLAGEVVKLARLVSSSARVTDARLRRVAREASRALGLRRLPLLLHSPRASMPITWGVRHPRVPLPDEAADWPDERLWAVLAHELAHARRGDWLVHMLAQAACAIQLDNVSIKGGHPAGAYLAIEVRTSVLARYSPAPPVIAAPNPQSWVRHFIYSDWKSAAAPLHIRETSASIRRQALPCTSAFRAPRPYR